MLFVVLAVVLKVESMESSNATRGKHSNLPCIIEPLDFIMCGFIYLESEIGYLEHGNITIFNKCTGCIERKRNYTLRQKLRATCLNAYKKSTMTNTILVFFRALFNVFTITLSFQQLHKIE